MKKNVIICLAIAAMSVMYTSCSKIDALISSALVSWTSTTVSFDVPVIADTTNESAIGTGSYTYNLDSLIKAQTSNQFGLKNVSHFYLTSCTLTILNPDAANNFANFQSASGTISTSANATPATIGNVTNNPDTYAATLSVPVNTTTDLKSYVSPSGTTTFSYSITGKARRATNKVLNATVHVEYSIGVKL
jgi:hypothetical protein